jgi:LPS-assembly protein
MPFPSRFVLTPAAVAVCALLYQPAAWAQAVDEASSLRLKPSGMLQETIPAEVRSRTPVFLSGDKLTGQTDQSTVIDGAASLRRGDLSIRADRLEYDVPEDLAKARGNVRINRAGNSYQGSELELKVDAFEGYFNEPSYQFLRNSAHGEAERIEFIDEKRAIIRNASYTTCRRQPGPSWMPDWILRAASLSIDEEEEIGRATGATLYFKNVPILPVPAFSFPLSGTRKSGLLPPTLGVDSLNGVEITVPYYWNIAPNRDATIYPTLMSKRGVDMGAEFRYLEPEYRGQWRGNFMPSDPLRSSDRWGYAISHQGLIPVGVRGYNPISLNLNLNRVSDDNYWRDFSRQTATLTQRLLPTDIHGTWINGPLTLSARSLKWQTLQDVDSPIVPPFDRLPQFVARYNRTQLWQGLDFTLEADTTRFESVTSLTGQPNARRSFVMAEISRPWQAPGWFVTPKLRLHSTQYQFDTALTTGATRAQRTLPTFSIDSGLVFERDAAYFGRSYRQTLEPRAFYTYTPFRDQSALPNYDSAANDFNFATIYTENAFGGHDRIADNNLLTLGATSRLLDPSTGAEAARFGIAQRLRFRDQKVTLPGGTAISERLSDIMVGAAVNWDPRWAVDATVQYNPKTRRSERSTLGGRYNPGPYRAISAAYRLQRGESESIDVGWQWPVGDHSRSRTEGRWYSVGRVNFSLKDRRIVDSIVGFEYDADCWLGRVVLERLQSSTSSANTRVLFQLEFVGFTRLGTNALQALKDNIPRYQYLREQVSAPSRFSNYE